MGQHGGFGVEYVQVVAQTRFVALNGNGVGRFGRVLCRFLFGLLAGNSLGGGQLVGHVPHRVDDGGVVGLDRGVQVGGLALEVGAQAAPFKQGQADGRAHPPLRAAALHQLVKTNAGEAGESGQVDVGVEQGLGVVDVAGSRFDAPARSHHIGPAAQQVQWHRLHLGLRICY